MNALQEAGDNPKKLWRIVKQLLGNHKRKNQILEINGYTDSADMANQINDFFVDIGPNLARDIQESLLNMDYSFSADRLQFEFVHTTEEEVSKLLKSISNNKSMGLDEIPIRFLKLNLELTTRILVHIINLSTDTLTVPSGWKRACLTPLFKEGECDKPGIYRPVAILPAS